MLNSWQMLKSCFCEQAGSPSLSGTLTLDLDHTTYYEQNVGKTLDNREALNHFLASVERRAFRMAEIATSDREHALDIVQDAMMSLVKNYSHKDETEWGPLFHRILQSKIRDWYRRSRTRNSVFSWLRNGKDDDENNNYDPIQRAADTVSLTPDNSADNEHLMDIALDAIRRLPLRQQQAFMLRAWEGMDVRETARAMNCSQGSVKTHYFRATHALKRYLEAYMT